jgi:hypothetical protein
VSEIWWAMNALDFQINQLIALREFYGLTEDEVRVVEEKDK